MAWFDGLPGPVAAAGLGVLAGLAVAVPLGAVGVLLVQTGMLRGRRAGLAAASGVATVDLVYAAAAVTVGGRLAEVLAGREDAVRVVGALVLASLAVAGLVRVRRAATQAWTQAPTQAPAPTQVAAPAPAARGGAAFWTFVGLTAVNPLTAVYFTALAASVGGALTGAAAAGAFVAGVAVASWAWQAALALLGAVAGARLPPTARTWTAVVGSGVVLVLAVALGLSAWVG